MVLRFLVYSFLGLALLAGSAAFGQEPKAAESGVSDSAPLVLPGLSELGSRSAALTDFIVRSEERLTQLADLARPREALSGIREQLAKLSAEMEPFGPPESWYVDRLNNYLNQFGQLRQSLRNLQSRLSSRQQETEIIREHIQQDQDFWAAWEMELKKQDLKLPQQTFAQVKQQLERLNLALVQTTDQLLQFQEQIGVFQRELLQASDRLSQPLAKLRQATFRRNAYSFLAPEYYRQFDDNLVSEIGDGLLAATSLDRHYLQDNLLLIVLLGGIFLIGAGFLRRYRSQPNITEDWTFILRRPLAAAGFFSILLCWLWLPAPPALVRFFLEAATVITATALALALLENRRQMKFLVLAAGIFLSTGLLQLISLPQPLFRLYIVLLSIVFVPLLYRQINLSRRLCISGQGRLFRALLRFAMLVLSLSLVAQLAGYMNFSTWLIQATFETGMMLLFARMAVLLCSGGFDLLTEVLVRAEWKFFQEFGAEFSARLKRLFKFILYGLTAFYLLPVWRVFPTLNDSWIYVSELALDIGNFSLTLQMVGSALFAFYLAMQASWVLQRVTETQVLRRRNADRGVQDAVKKLIHYAIVLVGFLLALSLLGFGLQNFVVLLGALGVGIGFGLQEIVNNFLSGLILLFERPIKVGDGVLIDGEYGTVLRIGLRSTVVKNLEEAELIVPNSQMITQKVTNWTLSNRRIRLTVPVGVAYGSDLETVLAVLNQVAAEHPLVLGFPKPSPVFVLFGASSLDFELRVWISDVDQRIAVRNDLLLAIDRRFREEQIEIPFSQHDLHIRSVSPGVLPAELGTE